MIVMSVASVLLSIMIALIPFIASRIVRGDVGSTLMTVISGAMTAGAVASGLAFAGGGGLAAGRQATSGGPPSPPSGGAGSLSQGSSPVPQGTGGGAVIGDSRSPSPISDGVSGGTVGGVASTSESPTPHGLRSTSQGWGVESSSAAHARPASSYSGRSLAAAFLPAWQRAERNRQDDALGGDGCRMMRNPETQREAPEIPSFTRYYEHDGMLRAYANRAMFLAILFAVIAHVLSSDRRHIYVRIQPPTVIRVDKDGNAFAGGWWWQRRRSNLADGAIQYWRRKLLAQMERLPKEWLRRTWKAKPSFPDLEDAFPRNYLSYTPGSPHHATATAVSRQT